MNEEHTNLAPDEIRYKVYQKWFELFNEDRRLWSATKKLGSTIELLIEEAEKNSGTSVGELFQAASNLLILLRKQITDGRSVKQRKDCISQLVTFIQYGRGQMPPCVMGEDDDYEEGEEEDRELVPGSFDCDQYSIYTKWLGFHNEINGLWEKTEILVGAVEMLLDLYGRISIIHDDADEDCEDFFSSEVLDRIINSEDAYKSYIVPRSEEDKRIIKHCLNLLDLWKQECFDDDADLYRYNSILKLVNALYERKGQMPHLKKPGRHPRFSDREWLEQMDIAKPISIDLR
jgi:hypothetical protein